jgi:farnesyl-diphosphate farnesyltransferase
MSYTPEPGEQMTIQNSETRIEQDIAWCRAVLPAVSRTFALGIELLRDPLRDEIGLAYLICRILDTLEDTTSLPADARAGMLERFAREFMEAGRWAGLAADVETMFLDAALAGPDIELARNTGVVLRVFHSFRPGAREAMHQSIVEMAEGMAETVRREMRGEGLRLHDEADLKRYCYYVAGTVGKLLCNMWALDRPEVFTSAVKARLDEHAVTFGLGLQVTNIIKGVTDDIARGVAYVPNKLFEAAGIDLATLVENPRDPRGREVVRGLVQMTLLWLDEALEYTLIVPATERDIRLFCALPLVFAVRTLSRAMRTTEVFSEKVLKITRDEVMAIHAELQECIGDDSALRAIYERERTSIPVNA